MTAHPPFALGEEQIAVIDNLAFGGEGVGRVEGVTLFVPDVCPGETVRVRIREVQKRFCRAELLEVIEPAPGRETALCPHFGTCGGCQFQHLDYAAEQAAKTDMVRQTLRRVGHLEVPVAPIVPSPVPYGYRNKVDFTCIPAADDPARIALAYHDRDHQPFAVDQCPLLPPELSVLLDQVTAWLAEAGWPPYDPAASTGLIRGLGLRYSSSCREATVLLTTGRRELPEKGARAAALRAATGRVVGLRHMARTRASQSATGQPMGGLEGRALRYQVGGLSLRVAPEAFFQTNELLLEPLIEAVRAAAAPQPGDRLADLYAGVGTFGLSLARDAGEVVLVEVDRSAVHDAEANLRHNGLGNVTIRRGQVEQQLGEALREGRLDRILLDPPRAGCSEAVLALVARARPRRIVYVSCDPATLARDLARLGQHGYTTIGVQPFDLFPRTTHIECVTTLEPAS